MTAIAIAHVVLVVLLLVCTLWHLLRFLPAGADAAVPALPYMIALTPFLWIPSLAVAVAGLALRDWGLAVIALVVTLLIVAAQMPYWALRFAGSKQPHVNGHGAHGLTVMTLNCRYGRADANAIVDLVRERRVRALALQELTADLVRRLDDAGLDTLLPYRMLGEDRADDNGGFNGVWTAAEPLDSGMHAVTIPAADVPFAVVPVMGGDGGAALARIVSAHPFSPMRGVRQWGEGIRGLAALTDDAFARGHAYDDMEDDWPLPSAHDGRGSADGRGHHGGHTDQSADRMDRGTRSTDRGTGMGTANNAETSTRQTDWISPGRMTVLMGDLNSGLDHPSFRGLLRAGFHDATLGEARGKHATFPRWLPWPRIVLDHVLVARHGETHDGGARIRPRDAHARFLAVRSVVIPGTDHLALVATLRP